MQRLKYLPSEERLAAVYQLRDRLDELRRMSPRARALALAMFETHQRFFVQVSTCTPVSILTISRVFAQHTLCLTEECFKVSPENAQNRFPGGVFFPPFPIDLTSSAGRNASANDDTFLAVIARPPSRNLDCRLIDDDNGDDDGNDITAIPSARADKATGDPTLVFSGTVRAGSRGNRCGDRAGALCPSNTFMTLSVSALRALMLLIFFVPSSLPFLPSLLLHIPCLLAHAFISTLRCNAWTVLSDPPRRPLPYGIFVLIHLFASSPRAQAPPSQTRATQMKLYSGFAVAVASRVTLREMAGHTKRRPLWKVKSCAAVIKDGLWMRSVPLPA